MALVFADRYSQHLSGEYYKSDQPGQLQPCENSTYDTGDIVEISNDHYLTIKGREKRFAKIAGEMVSLSAIETEINQKWPQFNHCIEIVSLDQMLR